MNGLRIYRISTQRQTIHTGRRLCDRWEGRRRGLQAVTECHGHSSLQPRGPEQCVQIAFVHPPLGQCVLPQTRGTGHVRTTVQHRKPPGVFLPTALFKICVQTDVQEAASIVSSQEIRVVAELLQISPEGLQKAITYKVMVR